MILDLLLFGFGVTAVILSKRRTLIKIEYGYTFIGLLAVLILFHLVFGVSRWQLFPLYFILFTYSLLLGLQSYMNVDFGLLVKRIIYSTMIVLLITSITATLVFPVYALPNPSGSYSIGTRVYSITDTSREEPYSNEVYRRINIQVWYPSDDTQGLDLAPWLMDGISVARGLSKDMGFPNFTLDHTAKIVSNSYIDAPISLQENQYPLVIISHGWRGFRNLHTDYAEELASRGYIVVSIDHTYGSVATVFDDEVVELNLDALEPRETNENFLSDANLLVTTYGEDVLTTLNYLQELNLDSSSVFYQRIDMENVGLLGHSTGGGGDVYAALNDNRIDVLIGLDAWVEPLGIDVLEQGLEIDALFLRSGAWEVGPNNEYLYTLINNSVNHTLYQIDGTTHYDFAMVYMYSPLTGLFGFTGDVESDYLYDLLKDTIVNYFDQSLKDIQDNTFDISDYPEVQMIEPNVGD